MDKDLILAKEQIDAAYVIYLQAKNSIRLKGFSYTQITEIKDNEARLVDSSLIKNEMK